MKIFSPLSLPRAASIAKLALGLALCSMQGPLLAAPCAPTPTNLIGWWQAEGNANDLLGAHNGFLTNGASFVPGEAGQAFSLDGADQYVVIPDPSSTLQPASLTVEAWVNIDAMSGTQVIAAKPYGNGTLDSWALFTVGNALWGGVANSSGNGTFLTYTWSPAPNSWHHVAYTYDNATAQQALYVDGAQVSSGATIGPMDYDSNPMQIGADIENGIPAYFFAGAIDEVSLYSRALSAAEIGTIYQAGASGKCIGAPTILAQPTNEIVDVGNSAAFSVVAGGAAPLTYQWSRDGAALSGATNATLVIADARATNSGTYSVLVTDPAGSTPSSNAVLLVGFAPSITNQPAAQTVPAGAAASFSVGATGDGVLSYQWSFNGAVLSNATNASLVLSNVGSSNIGAYAVAVTSPFGSATSSNASLAIVRIPAITEQPRSQNVALGSTLQLEVTSDTLPQVASGTLQLWLEAGTGAVTDSSGHVSVWKDQSGNANDAVQTNADLQPVIVYPEALQGAAALRFNGVQDGIHGTYLHGPGNVGLSNAMTSFAVYNVFSNQEPGFIWLVGLPPGFGAVRGDADYQADMDFSTWGYGYVAPFVIPTNTYRIWNDVVNTNLDSLQMFDISATSSTNFTQSMAHAVSPQAGYYIGGVDPRLPNTRPYYNLPGEVAEVILYRGALNESDREAVVSYLKQKYYGGAAQAGLVSYQWQFDGTNIAGATNATLTISDMQMTNAGAYDVIVSNLAGAVTSSNAVVLVGQAPGISLQPSSQAIVNGAPVTFTTSANGDSPISYQWTFNGSPIAGATNTSFTIGAVTTNSAGAYAVIASNPFGIASSSNALLTVLVSTLEISDAAVEGGGHVTIPVILSSVGSESAVQFSLDFDPAALTFARAAIGASAQGDLLLVNSNEVASGRLGFNLLVPSGSLAAGSNDIVDVTFQGAVLTNAITTPVSFGDDPIHRQISDPEAQKLLAFYIAGTVAVSASQLEGDVAPLPAGDGAVTAIDWVQEERFVAGLDTITNSAEFQRADCAPRQTGGDGEVTVADLTQLGRYAAALDPLTAVGEFTTNGPSIAPRKTSNPRTLALVPATQGGATNVIYAQLAAQGGEDALQFSVNFNPAAVRYAGASIASGASGAVLVANTTKAATGSVGFVVAMPPGASSLSPGLVNLLQINFASISYSNNAALVFGDAPVLRQAVDAEADVLPVSYMGASVSFAGAAWPAVSVSLSSQSASLSWPLSAAASFTLETAPEVSGRWTPVAANTVTNGSVVSFTVPAGSGQAFYRLHHQ